MFLIFNGYGFIFSVVCKYSFKNEHALLDIVHRGILNHYMIILVSDIDL